MAEIEFNLGVPIDLSLLAAPNVGGTVGLPGTIPNAGGVYLILNTYGATHNRYMGVSDNIRTRFGGRQGAIFELGLFRAQIQGVVAFCGTMRYKNNAGGWINQLLYNPGSTRINLDGFNYDFEHIFIKGAHAMFGGTITNTQKVGPLINQAWVFPIIIRISWLGGLGIANGQVTHTLNAGAIIN